VKLVYQFSCQLDFHPSRPHQYQYRLGHHSYTSVVSIDSIHRWIKSPPVSNFITAGTVSVFCFVTPCIIFRCNHQLRETAYNYNYGICITWVTLGFITMPQVKVSYITYGWSHGGVSHYPIPKLVSHYAQWILPNQMNASPAGARVGPLRRLSRVPKQLLHASHFIAIIIRFRWNLNVNISNTKVAMNCFLCWLQISGRIEEPVKWTTVKFCWTCPCPPCTSCLLRPSFYLNYHCMMMIKWWWWWWSTTHPPMIDSFCQE
jgi:hypothetical protein